MSDNKFKKKLDEIKSLLFLQAAEGEVEKEEVVEEVKPSYATAEQFSMMKDELDSFKSEITEMLSAFAEMINSTEKNKVPAEMSAEKVEEEEVKEEVEVKEEEKEEVVEMSAEEKVAEPMRHNPESNVKGEGGFKIAAGRRMSTKDRVFAQLAQNGAWR
jgi:hypothetical protein